MATELCDRCVICDLCDVKDIVAPPPKCQNFVQRPMTNYDKLHAMSVEELAKWADKYFNCPPKIDCPKDEASCKVCWLRWLNEVCEDSTMEAEK